MYSSSPYIGDDSRILPIPVITYLSEKYYFYGLEGGYALAGDREKGIGFYATLSGRMEYYSEDDSYIFDGMEDTNFSVDGGLKLKVTKEEYGFETGAKYDILGNSDGYEIFGKVSRTFSGVFECKNLDISVSAGLSWRSDKLNDYYYGVEEKYETIIRSAYSADGGLDSNLGLRMTYKIDEKWSVFNTIKAEFLSSEITDSPLVDKDIIYSVMLGVAYKL